MLTHVIPLVAEHFHQVQGHLILNQFLQAYDDYDRRMAVLKTISATATLEYFKKDYAEMKTGIVETLITIVSSSSPLDQRELALNNIAFLCKDFRPLQKEFRRKGGIELIKKNLAFSDIDQSGNGTTYLLSVLDC